MIRTRFTGTLLLLCLGICVAAAACAADAEKEESRRVLGVYNSNGLDGAFPGNCNIHKYLEKPLNHLGMVMEYVDVNREELPDPSPYRAVIVWMISDEMENPEKLLPWLVDAMRDGVPLIFPDGIQPPNSPGGKPVHMDLVLKLLAGFGLENAPYALDDDFKDLRIHTLKPEFFSFETSGATTDMAFPVLRQTNPDIEVWQRIERKNDPEVHAVTMVSGAPGFWSMSQRLLYFSMDLPQLGYRVAWNLDPFAMLEKALNCRELPRPDITTFWGSRGAYSHVDVDGPFNMSQPDVPGASRYALEVAFENIWKKIPYPVTLGYIAADYDPDLELRQLVYGEAPEQTLAKPLNAWEKPHRQVAMELRELVSRIARLPHIQSGCHAYSHPRVWKNLTPGYIIRDYIPTYEREVRGAVEYLNKNVLPPDKPVELYQWTGDCSPPVEPLAILDEMGLPNINGGDPIFDSMHNSVFYICPISQPRGKYTQIHSSGCNENIYTGNWLGFKGAYNNVIETFVKSDAPRRLLPVNIYYHVFPAENLAGGMAITHAYEWASKQDLCWMTAREYVLAAGDYAKVRIGRTNDGGWWAEEYGRCPTLRFDSADGMVDMRRSRNVTGFYRHNGSLYVSLVPGHRAEVFLTRSTPEAPCLARSSGMLDRIDSGREWSARIRQWGPGYIELWVPAGEWTAHAAPVGGTGSALPVKNLGGGLIRVDFDGFEGKWLEVKFEK